MVKSVHYMRNGAPKTPRAIGEARESLMIVTPDVDEATMSSLFALSRPVDVNLLTSREAVKEGGRTFRDNLKQLQDINLNVDVRMTDESLAAFAIVDGEHVHCYSDASMRVASKQPENLTHAAESLWARSTPLKSRHLRDGETTPSA